MKTVSKWADTGSIRLHYLDNEGSGSLLLLLHGLTANAHAFDGLLAAGLGNHFHILSVDLRGRGLSDQPATGYTMKEHAADIIALLDHRQATQVVICGHSFGAFLALYLAAYFPERVEKLILMDAAVKMHPKTKEMLGPAMARLGQRFASFDAYLDKVKQAPYLSFWDETMRSYYEADIYTLADGTVMPRSKPEHMMEAVLKGSLGEPWAELIKENKKPSILINAPGIYTMDAALLPADLAMETVNGMENCRYVAVSGNHQTMLYGEGAQQIVLAIKEFLFK
ncbi:MAG: alpha/beta fold hydrolase [Bacteroidetes bacterium]|nr:alpha/beta fold hydrolase [Bacteroidota bacterium]